MNISDLIFAMKDLIPKFDCDVELVLVVDGSPDRSEELIREELKKENIRSVLVSLSRNYGAFSAIRAGLETANGDIIGVIAADLQEPPEILLDFYKKISNDNYDVVFGQRVGRKDPLITRILSTIAWSFYRKFINPDIPKGGVDVFGMTKKVKQSVLKINETNTSLVGLLYWVGFKRGYVGYKRRVREKGKSAWNFWSSSKYFMDSIFSFSDLPIKVVMRLGMLAMIVSFVLGVIILISRLTGKIQLPGYTPIALMLTTFTGFNALISAVIGNYVWRGFENTKGRPNSIIDSIEKFN
jgi:glycosyltransferase involved in cell wall biosynthesis